MKSIWKIRFSSFVSSKLMRHQKARLHKSFLVKESTLSTMTTRELWTITARTTCLRWTLLAIKNSFEMLKTFASLKTRSVKTRRIKIARSISMDQEDPVTPASTWSPSIQLPSASLLIQFEARSVNMFTRKSRSKKQSEWILDWSEYLLDWLEHWMNFVFGFRCPYIACPSSSVVRKQDLVEDRELKRKLMAMNLGKEPMDNDEDEDEDGFWRIYALNDFNAQPKLWSILQVYEPVATHSCKLNVNESFKSLSNCLAGSYKL